MSPISSKKWFLYPQLQIYPLGLSPQIKCFNVTNNSLSISSLGIAAQFRQGSWRSLSFMQLMRLSFPVPLGPVIKTRASVATLSIITLM
jgi:hypothetical protein